MHIAVTGSSGLIGTALCVALRDDGHQIVPVVRSSGVDGTIAWDPVAGKIDDHCVISEDRNLLGDRLPRVARLCETVQEHDLRCKWAAKLLRA